MAHLTPEQEAACAFAAGSVLVAAAAGAGKTTTLSERVVRRCLLGPDPVDIDRLLLVTFTEKAALEMRQRIGLELARRALAGETRAQAQLERLPTAHISTIHGFCLRLLREEWRTAGLDPDTAMLDERQAEILRRRALDATLDAAYQRLPGMADLVAYFGGMGEDQNLRDAMLDSLRFLDTLPDPNGFLREAAERQERPEEFRARLQEVMADDLRQVEEAVSLLRRAAVAARAAEGPSPYALALEREAAERSLAARDLLDWPTHCRRIAGLAEFGTLSGNSAPQRAASRKLREAAKRRLERLAAGLCALGEEELWRREQATQATLRDYASLLAAAMADYRRLKRQRQVLDFADLEQEAYRLLRHGGVAEALRQRFCEVLVDEFQDVNPLQAAIVDLVSRLGEGGNLFAVGDVKQSIYGFRHAAPTIFLEREAEARGRGAALYLRENFRSRPEILEVANAVFRQLMQEEASPVYDEQAELRAARSADTLPPDPDPRVRFVFAAGPEGEGAGDADELSAQEREADFVAREIRRLVASGHPIWDAGRGEVRAVRYADCAVLLRSLQGAAAYDDMFALHGVPATIQRNSGYLGGQELRTLVALLGTVELPERDWDLLVTLRAPWFGFSVDELWRVRQAASGKTLWQGLNALAADDRRMGRAVERIERWRQWSLAMPLDRLVGRLIADTEYAAHVAGLPRGAQRRRDIAAFQEAAERFAAQAGGGIGPFLAMFEERTSQELDQAPPDVELGDTVRVTSIHRSKGLEFPVVFVAGLGRNLRGGRQKPRLRLHRRLGMAAAYADGEGGLHPTVGWRAIEAAERRADLHEEIRLLYVAMTRARDRLYLTSHGEPGAVAGPLDPALLRTARSPVGWLEPPLSAPDLPVLWQVVRERGEQGEAAFESAAAAEAFDAAAVRAAFRALPERRLEPPEPLPLRLSASSLAEGERGYGAILRRRRGRQGGQGAGTARVAGVLTHRLLELINLRHPPSDLQAELRGLIARGALPQAAAQAIDLQAVGRFLASPTAARILGARRLEREIAFSVLADPSGRPDAAGETVLQGKIDLLLEDADGWLIVDFKTDHVAAAQVAEAARAYAGQVEAYRQALRAIAGVEADALLYFLAPGVAFAMAR